MFWDWYGSGDLRTLNPATGGVAFHAASIDLWGKDGVTVALRRIPLHASQDAYLMAVVRIEFDRHPDQPPLFGSTQRLRVADAVAQLVRITRVRALQLDFDAPAAAYSFYRQLIHDVHARIAPEVFLSITALMSWCGPDSWMQELGVDEIVPMAFDMGPAGAQVAALLRSGGELPFAACRAGIGVRDIESLVTIRPGQRVYIFPPARNWWSPKRIVLSLRRYAP